MGIRIRKALGYGFDDLEARDPRIDWERLNDFQEDPQQELFLEFCKKRQQDLASQDEWQPDNYLRKQQRWEVQGLIKLLETNDRYINLSRCFVHDPEFGKKEVMVVISPLFLKDRHLRYDDSIDYYAEAFYRQKVDELSQALTSAGLPVPSVDQYTNCQVVENGIYPYEGLVNADTSEPVSEWQIESIRHYLKEGELEKAEKFAQTYVGSDTDTFLSKLRLQIPGAIQLLAEFSGIVALDEIARLKPLYYSYWS